MSIRNTKDRIRHAISFEIIALAIFIPLSSLIFGYEVSSMGFIGVASATIATTWNFLYNMAFDKIMLKNLGHTRKTMRLRVFHALFFEFGLMFLLIPLIAFALNISLWAALKMDIAIVLYYLVFAFLFNIAYDKIFPIPHANKEIQTV